MSEIHEKTILVRPEHLNHSNTLYGGYMMKWADEMAFVAASIEYPLANFVTKVFEQFNFISPVKQGNIIKIRSQLVSTGNSSVRVKVWADNVSTGKGVFSTFSVMVHVEDDHSATVPKAPRAPKS